MFRYFGLVIMELQNSKIFWLCKAQGISFQSEINDLTKKSKVSRRSCLNTCSPPNGPQGLLANIKLIYWPIRGRNIARQVVYRCTRCFRANLKFLQPFMAPLPTVRVTSYHPFIKTIHLELVRDLSSDIFIAALFRFISRCGQCTHLHSNNGTNLTGSDKILKSWKADLYKEDKFQDQLTTLGVKSAKKHLIRVSNRLLLTYEETSTLLCRIEAVLNSRPITVSSSDPPDYCAVCTHSWSFFIWVSPLTLPPEPDSRLQHFWKRWSTEYIPQLQRRIRWTEMSKNLSIGDLAILRDETAPPIHWRLVRIKGVHPGADSVARVVTVRNI
ncbi:Integrase catalytic domain-containing protein [Aphis craccivora]|uniref:Integrase catalytic domain-containing protein n=1 Tax=Aphis craccivora TaxID=307492 RepID=A0A6G0Y679_APHCR|nr:Integrase catalytic domain-containing protein [Aphis craccivora]